ncbi:hypothetical protein [Streptomyces sp. CA-111067]|uniref:hypothetical protein n=1 Tax=Streptomyces sp. CA-111067 TaxID=3240046 RepID=UPI003D9538AE
MSALPVPPDDDVVVATFNLEQNGMGDPGRRRAAYEVLARHGVQLLFRQEMPGADQAQHAVMYEAEEALGLRGWLGEDSATAVFADTSTFNPLGHWPTPWSGFKLPPTAVTLQLRDAGPDSTPIIAVAAHLNYAVAAQRETEAGWITGLNDKWITLADGQLRHALMIGGLDGNSYPHQASPGECPLPVLDQIADHPHRAHRSRIGPVGIRVMDQVPHAVLHTAGVVDIAAHLAQTTGDTGAVAPTMLAYPTHGPDARVDWLVTSRHLLPVFHHVEVIDAQHLSDHNIVLARASRSRLAALLAAPAASAA